MARFVEDHEVEGQPVLEISFSESHPEGDNVPLELDREIGVMDQQTEAMSLEELMTTAIHDLEQSMDHDEENTAEFTQPPKLIALSPIQQLHEAVAIGSLDVAVSLIRSGVDANSTIADDNDGITPLMRACGSPATKSDMVYMLLKYGADWKQKDAKGRTALMWACEVPHGTLVRILIEAGAVAQGMSTDGLTCLLFACEHGDLKLVRYLIKHGKADVNELSPDDLSPLIIACDRGNALLAALLINEFSANVNLGHERTPLVAAVQKGDIVLVAFLLDKGADLNRSIKALNGISCLFQACDRGSVEMCKLLILRGANVNHCDLAGRTVLSYLCETNGFPHLNLDTIIMLVSLLLESNADPLISDFNGRTAVSFARDRPNSSILELLLKWMRRSRRK